MKDYETLPPIIVERGQGINLYDINGNCYKDVINMVVENKDKMKEFAEVLKEKEEMTGDEINEILYPETADAE